jgi:hypothetical protein
VAGNAAAIVAETRENQDKLMSARRRWADGPAPEQTQPGR